MPRKQTEITNLSEDAAKAYDRYRKARAAARRARKKAQEADQAREDLLREFGSGAIGRLPDGRLIVRTRQEREYAALPAKKVEWWEFHEPF